MVQTPHLRHHLQQQQQHKQQQQQQQQCQSRRRSRILWFISSSKIQYVILALLMITMIQWEYQTYFSNRQLLMFHLINRSSSSSSNSSSSISSSSISSWYGQEPKEEEDASMSTTIPSECFLSEEEMKNLSSSSSSSSSHHQDISWQGSSGLNQMVGFGFGGLLLCHELQLPSNNDTSTSSLLSLSATLRIEFDCQAAFEQVHGATGNQLLQFYGTRLAARAVGHVDIHVHCPDAIQHQATLILPWITGYFPAVAKRRLSSSSSTCNQAALSTLVPNVTQTCQAFLDIPIAYAIPDIRFDLRRMALSMIAAGGLAPLTESPIYKAAWKFQNKYLLGSNDGNNSSSSNITLTPPPHQGRMDVPFTIMPPSLASSSDSLNNDSSISNTSSSSSSVAVVQLDDAVIHFRCGDLMSLGHPDYCFVPFFSFSRRISPHVRSIGIVTQPFEKTNWSRAVDVKETGLHRCRVVVQDYQAFLQEAFPTAIVTIHNSPDESMTLAYTRMILANQTFCMASTFPIFPALATFGQAYIHVPRYERAPSRFLLSLEQPAAHHHHQSVAAIGSSNNNDNIHLLRDEPFIMAGDLIKLWKRQGQDAVLSWFRQEPQHQNASSSSTSTFRSMNIGNVRARVSV